ncbi:MAG: phosphate acyltransferase [Bacilli bacterium]|jgi:glycerol-3-phosphate acyltransferase PlsX|nr:phosphate acyltransferase [Bacilli bacterium]
MRIAIDVMGGDHAPGTNVEGALRAAKEWQDIELVLVGDSAQIEPLLTEKLPNIRIHHTSEVIEAEDEPVKAVRRKKDASMVVAGRLVKEKQADAMISAGNTGALMATGLLIVGRMEGIERPALAPMIPTMQGVGQGLLCLDLGANMDASAENLLQYAIMGSVYRSKVDGISQPRVGLLNVGTETMKGNELTKAAFALLSQAPIHFIGNVEASNVLRGNCDILVCDGFVGNIMLKSLEGALDVIFSELKTEFTRTAFSKIAGAILRPGLRRLKQKGDSSEYGGAPLLGVDGLVIKCHGSSNATAVKNGIRLARHALMNDVVQAISTEISKGK